MKTKERDTSKLHKQCPIQKTQQNLWKGRGEREPCRLYMLPKPSARRPDGLTMPIFFIFLRNVSGCTPSSSPAPPGPWIFPPVRFRAASICSRTTSSSEQSVPSLRDSEKPDAAPTDAAPVFSDRRASPRPAALSGLCSRTERNGTGHSASGGIPFSIHSAKQRRTSSRTRLSSASPCSGAGRPGTACSRTGWR